MAGGLGLSGVFSGIDTEVLIAHELTAASVPLRRLDLRRSEWEAKTEAVADLQSRVVSLKDIANRLRDAGKLRSAVANSSDASIVTAFASSGATEGVHEIVVNRLAAAEKEIHSGLNPTETWTHLTSVATADTEYISGADISGSGGVDYKFVFQFGDETQVVVDLSSYSGAGITLNELVSEINTAAGYAAAAAYDDGGVYKLRMQAQNAGEGKELTITDDDSVGILTSTDNFARNVDGDVGSDAVVGTGDFVYTYDGQKVTLTFTSANTSLGQLRDRINNDADNPGVTASILKYDAGGDQVYHLVLTGNQTGSDYTIAIEAETTLTGFGPGANWIETQSARDSQFRVDGYPPADWIERSGNTLSDVISGVALTLQGTGEGGPPGTATVTLTRDTSQLTADLENVVAAYNGIATTLAAYSEYDQETETLGILQGDSVLNNMLAQFRDVLIASAPGFKDGEDTFTMASQIGIEIDRDGMFVVNMDSGTYSSENAQGQETGWVRMGLSDALSEDYYAVLNLIGAVGRGDSDSTYLTFDSSGGVTEPGAYTVKATFDAGVLTGAQIKLASEPDTDYRDASFDPSTGKITGAQGNEQDPNPEYFLRVLAVFGGTGTQIAEVRVQQGFAGALHDVADGFLHQTEGLFATSADEYEANIDRIDKRIEFYESLLVTKEKRLRAKYARLEATLARLDFQRGAFEALAISLEAGTNRGTTDRS